MKAVFPALVVCLALTASNSARAWGDELDDLLTSPPAKVVAESEASATDLADQAVVAFAGIGRPEKFFATLADLRCRIAAAHAYADHHAYTPDEIMRLADEAAAKRAIIVTTASAR